jgi:type VI secretion system protein ImpJ
MLLRPEHFEEMNSRQELLLQHYASSAPFSWGVSRLLVDESSLLQGRFALLELEAKLPDGLAIRVGPDWPTQPSINLGELDHSFQQQPFFIYLAALTLSSRADASDATRFVAASESDETLRTRGASLSDEEDEEDEEPEQPPIPRLRPRFHLIASPRGVSSKYTSMPIARIAFRNGIWALDEAYVPPSERISTSSPLSRAFAATLRRVRELAMLTQDRWRSMSADERGQNRAEASNVRHLVAALPLCDALLASGQVHPFTLYLGLCSLAGQISAIASDPVPPPFRPYDHDDPAHAFSEIDTYLNHVLSEGDSRDYIGFPMTYDQGVFTISFAPEWSGRRLVLALRASGTQETAVASWFESALVGVRSLQESMRERRVLGANRSRLSTEPGLFAGSGVVLYQLQEDRQYLRAGELLDIASGPSVPGSNIPVEIILYVRQLSN